MVSLLRTQNVLHVVSLLRTQNVLHVWKDFAWGVAKKMGYVADCIRILEDFSPESFSGSGVCMTNTIPQITIPDTFVITVVFLCVP